MKIQTVLLLASVFILPTQASAVEKIKDFSQSRASKSAVTTPAKAVKKLKIMTPIKQGNAPGGSVANSGPATVQKPTLPSNVMVIPGLGPNLTVAIRYEHDACVIDKSPLGTGIYDARCDLIITVKNSGDTATPLAPNGGFKLNLWYFNYNGELKNGFRYIGNLGINEEKVIIYDHRQIRSFKKGTPFTAEVDRSNIVKETNERDNSAVIWLGQ